MIWDVIIVGAGPAGLMAASILKNKRVLVLEKMQQVGMKLLISGAGQCNLTHAGPIEGYADCYGKKWRFVRESLRQFTNEDVMALMKSHGLALTTLDNGKVFPKSLKAADVVTTLLKIIQNNQVELNTGEKVESITHDEHWLVKTNNTTYESSHVIVATGGLTFPTTGSTGDAYEFAKKIGVKAVETRFALASVYINNYALQSLSGLSFKDASITVFREKKVGSYTGDLLITHFGFSGPVVMNNSRYFRSGDQLKVNFTDFRDKKVLEETFLKLCADNPKKAVKNLIQPSMLFSRLADKLFELLSIDADTKASDFKKADRKKLINAMYEYEVTIGQVGKAHIAMVTAGGISTKALNSKTFECKKIPSLYFIGECIDVDGDTGGYNIQFAFSSGAAAANHIMED